MEAKLILSLVVCGFLYLVVVTFIKWVGTAVPQPDKGFVYEVVFSKRSGGTWSVWVDCIVWVVYEIASWALNISVVAFTVTVVFVRWWAESRAKRETRL